MNLPTAQDLHDFEVDLATAYIAGMLDSNGIPGAWADALRIPPDLRLRLARTIAHDLNDRRHTSTV